MAIPTPARAAAYAKYLEARKSNSNVEAIRIAAEEADISEATMRTIIKEVTNASFDTDINKLAKAQAIQTHIITDLVAEHAPAMLEEAEALERSIESLNKLTISAHKAGEAVMNRVAMLAPRCENVPELVMLAEAVFKVNQAFFSQGMNVTIQQNNVSEGALTSALGSRFTR